MMHTKLNIRLIYICILVSAFDAVLSNMGIEPLMAGEDMETETDYKELRKAANKLNNADIGVHVVQMKDGVVFEEDENMFHPVDMPTDFESYDIIDVDGYITLEELADATGARENIQLAFNASDKDGDGKLTKNEFNNAPWSLSFSKDESEGSGSLENEDITDNTEIQIDPEIKRYLLTEQELKELQKSRGYP